MTDKTHQLIGLTVASAAFFALHTGAPVTGGIATTVVIGSFLGSILPDIDQPTSNFWDAVPLGDVLGKVVPKTLGGHRNLSHSLLGVALFTWLFHLFVATFLKNGTFIDQMVLIQSFFVGFVAHLAADSVTVLGIPLFWPFGGNMGFPPRPFHGARIVTGKWFEHLIVLPVSFVALGIVLAIHAQRFCVWVPMACT